MKTNVQKINEYLQSLGEEMPFYRDSNSGSSHDPIWEVTMLFEISSQKYRYSGTAFSKKEAKQLAAINAVKDLLNEKEKKLTISKLKNPLFILVDVENKPNVLLNMKERYEFVEDRDVTIVGFIGKGSPLRKKIPEEYITCQSLSANKDAADITLMLYCKDHCLFRGNCSDIVTDKICIVTSDFFARTFKECMEEYRLEGDTFSIDIYNTEESLFAELNTLATN